jgi:hypothetical protein
MVLCLSDEMSLLARGYPRIESNHNIQAIFRIKSERQLKGSLKVGCPVRRAGIISAGEEWLKEF